MAAGVKYRVEFFDIFNKRVQVDFLTKDYTGDIKYLTASASPVSLSFKGDDDSTWQSIFTSQATIKVLAGIDDMDFFEDIATMEDDTFGVDVRVQRKVLGSFYTTEYQWNGWCVPDEQQRTFSYQEQEVTVTAICPLSRAKGYSLLDEDGNYIHGKHALSYYINQCIAPAFSEDNTAGSYSISVSSTIRLSHESGDDTIPPTFDGIGVDAEAFNDDDGRPINAYDVLNKIMTAFICRCFYENRTLYIYDIADLGELSSFTEKNVTYKNAVAADINSDLVLIKNSENITTLRSFKESNCTFKYSGVAGLLIDGNMLDWTDEMDGGHILNVWEYSDSLSNASDFTQRRFGNGRVESPYGFKIRYGNSSIPTYEALGTKTESNMISGDVLNLDMEVIVTYPLKYPTGGVPRDMWYNFVVILVNDIDLTKCLYLNHKEAPATSGDPTNPNAQTTWEFVDLSSTDFADGHIDFGISSDYYASKVLDGVFEKQKLSIECPPIPMIGSGSSSYQLSGRLYFLAKYMDVRIIDDDGIPGFDDVEITFYSALLSRDTGEKNQIKYTGEKVYITRDTKVSTQTQSREIELNTSANDSASGALVAMVDYTDYLGVERKANSPLRANPGLSKDVPDLSWGNILPLIKYNAMAVMRFNYNQLKIDIEAQGANCPFATPLSLSALYDSERPSTAIYNERFLQLNQTYDLKTCQRKMTIASMKVNFRTLSTVSADDTHDLYEYYQTVQQ